MNNSQPLSLAGPFSFCDKTVIQFALIFILGVLVAVFVVILLGPSVWRRAVFLARRQIHAELPVSLAEIQADRDGLRAEHAVAVSRAEQTLKEEREKTAEQQARLGRQYDELKRILLLEGEVTQLAQEVAERRKTAEAVLIERDTAVEKAEIVEAEVERLQNHLSALQGLSDTLRIEISAKEAEYGRLANELSEMRRDRKNASVHYNEVSTQLTATQTELKSEKRRNSELQQKLDRLMAELSDAQEKLEHHMRNGADFTAASLAPEELSSQNAVLREEMASLAARIVAATAEKEGADSPIHGFVKAEAPAKKGRGKMVEPKSLASRIRDLQ